MRISSSRMFSIVISSFGSIIVLIYQTLDYYANGTCCGDRLPEILATFRQYGSISLYYANVKISLPISLMGIFLMGIIILQTLILAYLPLPRTYTISNAKITFDLTLPEKFLSLYHVFLTIQLLFYSLLVINLIYIELFVIRSVCLLCTVSQGTILLSTVLIGLWSPTSKKSQQQEEEEN